MSIDEEQEAQIRREAIADERTKVVRFLERGMPSEQEAARKISRGEHLERDRRASVPTVGPRDGCGKLRVNGKHSRCGS